MERQCIKLIFQYTSIKRLRVLIKLVQSNLRKMNRRQKLALVLLLLLSKRRRERNNRPNRIGRPPIKIRRIARNLLNNVESDTESSYSSFDSSNSRSSLSSSDLDLDFDETEDNAVVVNSTQTSDAVESAAMKQEDVDPDLAELVAYDMNTDMEDIKPENVVGDQQELNEHGIASSIAQTNGVKEEEP